MVEVVEDVAGRHLWDGLPLIILLIRDQADKVRGIVRCDKFARAVPLLCERIGECWPWINRSEPAVRASIYPARTAIGRYGAACVVPNRSSRGGLETGGARDARRS